MNCNQLGGNPGLSNGKVGTNGISYFGMNQWQVASLQPKHLAAMCRLEGAADFLSRSGPSRGIASVSLPSGNNSAVVPRQHGKGANGRKSRLNGEMDFRPRNPDRRRACGNRKRNYGKDILGSSAGR